MFPYRRGWLKGECPSCGADKKYGVNLSWNRTNCFKCGYHKRPAEVIMELEGIDNFFEVFHFLNSFKGIDYYKIPLEAKEIKKETILPEGYTNIKRGNSFYAKSARNYLIKRGFDIEYLSMKGFGYSLSERYYGYIIMPYYFKGKLIYYNARSFLPGYQKFKNPTIEDFGIGKSMIMYNMDSLNIYKKCYLFESVTNCLTIGDNAIGTGGKKISNFQKNLIIKSNCKKFIIGLDRDGVDDAINIALELIQWKKIKILIMPDERDVNDLGKKATLYLEKKSHYLDYQSLIKLKNNWIYDPRT